MRTVPSLTIDPRRVEIFNGTSTAGQWEDFVYVALGKRQEKRTVLEELREKLRGSSGKELLHESVFMRRMGHMSPWHHYFMTQYGVFNEEPPWLPKSRLVLP